MRQRRVGKGPAAFWEWGPSGGRWSLVAKPLPARGRSDLAPEDLLRGCGCTLCLACEKFCSAGALWGIPGVQVSRMGKGPQAPAREGGRAGDPESQATGRTSVLEPGVSSRSAWPPTPSRPHGTQWALLPPGWTFTSSSTIQPQCACSVSAQIWPPISLRR